MTLAFSANAAEEDFPRPPTDPLNLRFLAEAGAGEYYFIELSTLSGSREALSVWLLDLYNPAQTNPAATLGGRWTRWVYDCDAASGFPDSDVYLDVAHTLFGGVVPDPGVIALPEGTVGRIALDAACNGVYLYPEGRSFTTMAEAVMAAGHFANLPR